MVTMRTWSGERIELRAGDIIGLQIAQYGETQNAMLFVESVEQEKGKAARVNGALFLDIRFPDCMGEIEPVRFCVTEDGTMYSAITSLTVLGSYQDEDCKNRAILSYFAYLDENVKTAQEKEQSMQALFAKFVSKEGKRASE